MNHSVTDKRNGDRNRLALSDRAAKRYWENLSARLSAFSGKGSQRHSAIYDEGSLARLGNIAEWRGDSRNTYLYVLAAGDSSDDVKRLSSRGDFSG